MLTQPGRGRVDCGPPGGTTANAASPGRLQINKAGPSEPLKGEIVWRGRAIQLFLLKIARTTTAFHQQGSTFQLGYNALGSFTK